MEAHSEQTGGCLCGTVRYTVQGAPLLVSHCACRHCQKASGAGHTTVMGLRVGQLSFSGQTKAFSVRADSGALVTRHFCPACGSRLFTTAENSSDLIFVQMGTLDNPSAATPTMAIYRKVAAAWDHIDPSLPTFEAMPPTA